MAVGGNGEARGREMEWVRSPEEQHMLGFLEGFLSLAGGDFTEVSGAGFSTIFIIFLGVPFYGHGLYRLVNARAGDYLSLLLVLVSSA